MSTATVAAPAAALPQLITINDVIAATAVSRSSIYRLVDIGALRAIKIGGAVRFKREDVLAYIERQATVSP